MKRGDAIILAILVLLTVSSGSSAEYLIYLRSGNYIIADRCTFAPRQEIGKDGGKDARPERDESLLDEDCIRGKPSGQIYWSTMDGHFGELNADDVYHVFGSKTLASIKPHRETKPLENYLIRNRGESFVSAKIFQEKDGQIYGLKRDDLAIIDRRGVTEIVPEADVKSRSGDGLCPGERAEFDVTEARPRGQGRFGGVFRNLSRETCMEVSFGVEVYERGDFKGIFQVQEAGVVRPNASKRFDARVPERLRSFIERFAAPEGGVQICYTKVRSLGQCEAEVRQQK